MSEFESDLTIIMQNNLSKSKHHLEHSDLYNFNPLTSSYRCYTCQKIKNVKPNTRIMKQGVNKKKKNLQVCKFNDIIIKPWHPFLREFQKFFKNSNQTPQQKDAIIQLYEIIRRQRTQLMDNIRQLQAYNASVNQTIEMLATYSIDEVENQYTDPLNKSRSSLKMKIQEQQKNSYREQINNLQEQIRLLEGREDLSLKNQIQTILRLQKDVQLQKKDMAELQAQILVYEQEVYQLTEENYYLYYLVRLDRHALFYELMKLYPPNQLQESQIQYFELYLCTLEEELSKVKLLKTRLQVSADNMERQTEDFRRDSQMQLSSELKMNEERWYNEKSRIEESLSTLKLEFSTTQRAEKELRQICKDQQNEIDRLRHTLHECQNGMNTVSHQHLIMRQENDSLNKQIAEQRLTIQNLELYACQPNIKIVEPNQAAKDLAMIILSKQKPTDKQQEILHQFFGDFSDQIIQMRQELTHESNEKLLAQLNDLRVIKEKLEKQSVAQQIQLDRIKQEVEYALATVEQNGIIQQQKSADKINRQTIQNVDPINHCLLAISSIVNNKDDYTKTQRLKSQNPYAQQQKKDDEFYMLLMQAIVIEEMISQAELQQEQEQIEDFSDMEAKTNEYINAIDEQDEEDSNDSKDVDQSGFKHPQPYENVEYAPNGRLSL